MKIFYYTSTGNNLHISKSIGGELYSIPKILKDGPAVFEDEAIGIVFPCYSLGTPKIVVDFLEQVKLKSKYTFAIMSYGNMDAGALWHFEKIANRNGIKMDYLNSILMVDNAVDVFDVEKQIINQGKKNIEEHLNEIVQDIQSRKRNKKQGNFVEKSFTSLVQRFYKKHSNKDAAQSFIVESTCSGCGICEKVCPYENIKFDEKPQFLNQCGQCYACSHHCPQNAIRVKGEKGKGQFRNEHVTLQELIEANDLTCKKKEFSKI